MLPDTSDANNLVRRARKAHAEQYGISMALCSRALCALTAFFDWHVFQAARANVFSARTDQPVVFELFEHVRGPA